MGLEWKPRKFEDLFDEIDPAMRSEQMSIAEYSRAQSNADDDLDILDIEETYARTLTHEEVADSCTEIQQLLNECSGLPGRERPIKSSQTHRNQPISQSILNETKFPILMAGDFFKFRRADNMGSDNSTEISSNAAQADSTSIYFNEPGYRYVFRLHLTDI